MNYPTIIQNPLLQKKQTKQEKLEMEQMMVFDNMKRPISGYQPTRDLIRPFSTKDGGETLMQRRKELQVKAAHRIETSNQ